MEEARIGQLDRDKLAGNILYRRQESGSWKRVGNGGDREKPVRKGVLERGW